MVSFSNFKFYSRKIELSDEAIEHLLDQDWATDLEKLAQKITNAATNTEDRINTPEGLES